MDSPPQDDHCSICHDDFTLPCQANCSHWFCGSCILRVWHHGPALQPCKCPICRRVITLLVPSTTTGQQNNWPEADQVLSRIARYNQSFGGGPRSLIEKLGDLPFFLRRMLRDFMDPHRALPLLFRARIFMSLMLSAIYVLSPIDIIPEGVFGVVGLLDDLLVLMVVFLHLTAVYRSILLYRHGAS